MNPAVEWIESTYDSWVMLEEGSVPGSRLRYQPRGQVVAQPMFQLKSPNEVDSPSVCHVCEVGDRPHTCLGCRETIPHMSLGLCSNCWLEGH